MSDVLSQSEIDELLVAMSRGEIEPDGFVGGRHVRPFDFMRPSKFSKETLRTVELMHETFCRSVQTQLSGVVRTPVGIEVVSADQVTYREFLNSIPTPSLLSIVTMEPFEGNAVIEVNLPLALSIVDRLVGGPGTQRPKPRELTEIEQALLGQRHRHPARRVHRGLVDAWSRCTSAWWAPRWTPSSPRSWARPRW